MKFQVVKPISPLRGDSNVMHTFRFQTSLKKSVQKYKNYVIIVVFNKTLQNLVAYQCATHRNICFLSAFALPSEIHVLILLWNQNIFFIYINLRYAMADCGK